MGEAKKGCALKRMFPMICQEIGHITPGVSAS